jgi:gliding motility-associated-like protein
MKTTLHLPVFLCFLLATSNPAGAQCVTINNLPDSIKVCKQATVQLSPTINSTGLLATMDTTWTPATGLSNPNIINPVVTTGTTSQSYTLTITALGANNLVVNGDFTAGASGFTSGYIYGTGGPLGILSTEGEYAIATDPLLTHISFASFGDHTTGTGNMMVVNGAAVPNVDVWCQTITVQPNTTYDFSAWAATAHPSNPAVLQFSINGVLLGAPFNLPLATGTWNPFNATWFSGPSTSATICISNQTTATGGNDFAIDDIEFREICVVTDSVYIGVTNLQPAIDTTVILGCLADTVNFAAIENGDTADQYIWDFGDGNGSTLKDPQHIYTVQGIYTAKLVTKKDGCADSATVTINTIHVLTIDFTMDDDSVCLGQDIQFTSTAGSTLPPTYYWNFGDSTTSTDQAPLHTYTKPGLYTVMHVVNDQIPCFDTIYKDVFVSVIPFADATLSDSTICEGQAVTLSADIESGYTSYNWNFGDGTITPNQPSVTAAFDTSGSYTISLFVDYLLCPDVTVSKTVTVFPMPVVDLGPDTSMCPNGDAILLTNPYFNAADQYFWSTGDTFRYVAVRHPAIYWTTATTPAGCSTTDSIEVFKNCYLDIPNSFTPNGDGVNEFFLPRQLLSKGLTSFSMSIFNRWGQKIFETERIDGRGWDGRFNGKEQPMGVYVYLIEASFKNHTSEKYQGNLTLIR